MRPTGWSVEDRAHVVFLTQLNAIAQIVAPSPATLGRLIAQAFALSLAPYRPAHHSR